MRTLLCDQYMYVVGQNEIQVKMKFLCLLTKKTKKSQGELRIKRGSFILTCNVYMYLFRWSFYSFSLPVFLNLLLQCIDRNSQLISVTVFSTCDKTKKDQGLDTGNFQSESQRRLADLCLFTCLFVCLFVCLFCVSSIILLVKSTILRQHKACVLRNSKFSHN